MNFINVFFHPKDLNDDMRNSTLFNPLNSFYLDFLRNVINRETINISSYDTSMHRYINELNLMTKTQKITRTLENALKNSTILDHPFAWIPIDNLSIDNEMLYESCKASIFVHNSQINGVFSGDLPPINIVDIGEIESFDSQLLDSLAELEIPKNSNINSQSGFEMSAEFYDQTFTKHQHMKIHYTESRYYSLWSILVDRLVNANIKNILDVGCGPGQLALFIQDKGIPNYLGIDFSPARIAHAKKLNLSYKFICCDAFSTDLFDSYDYDCVISLEFLEHIHKDLEILSKVRSGSRFMGTVPNFPYIAHVRHFKTQEEVYDRYSHLFQKLQVTTHLRGKEGVKYFILDGILLNNHV